MHMKSSDLARLDWQRLSNDDLECPSCRARIPAASRTSHTVWHRELEQDLSQSEKPRVVVYCEGERVSLADAASASVIIKIVKDRYGLAKVDFQRAIEAILP